MLEALAHWDRVFAVLEDDDHEKLQRFGLGRVVLAEARIVGGPKVHAIGSVVSPEPNGSAQSALPEGLSDAEIDGRIAERIAARARRDFAASDKIRDELLQAGVILEDTKAGTRWKRK